MVASAFVGVIALAVALASSILYNPEPIAIRCPDNPSEICLTDSYRSVLRPLKSAPTPLPTLNPHQQWDFFKERGQDMDINAIKSKTKHIADEMSQIIEIMAEAIYRAQETNQINTQILYLIANKQDQKITTLSNKLIEVVQNRADGSYKPELEMKKYMEDSQGVISRLDYTTLTKMRQIINQMLEGAESGGEKVSNIAELAGEKVVEGAKSGGEKVSNIAELAGEKVVEGARSGGEKVSNIAELAGEKVVEGRRTIQHAASDLTHAAGETVAKIGKKVIDIEESSRKGVLSAGHMAASKILDLEEKACRVIRQVWNSISQTGETALEKSVALEEACKDKLLSAGESTKEVIEDVCRRTAAVGKCIKQEAFAPYRQNEHWESSARLGEGLAFQKTNENKDESLGKSALTLTSTSGDVFAAMTKTIEESRRGGEFGKERNPSFHGNDDSEHGIQSNPSKFFNLADNGRNHSMEIMKLLLNTVNGTSEEASSELHSLMHRMRNFTETSVEKYGFQKFLIPLSRLFYLASFSVALAASFFASFFPRNLVWSKSPSQLPVLNRFLQNVSNLIVTCLTSCFVLFFACHPPWFSLSRTDAIQILVLGASVLASALNSICLQSPILRMSKEKEDLRKAVRREAHHESESYRKSMSDPVWVITEKSKKLEKSLNALSMAQNLLNHLILSILLLHLWHLSCSLAL